MSKQKNQGEGDRESAVRFNKKETEFAESGKVEKKAKEAKKALEGDEAAELASAEAKGKSRARH